jgi:acetyl-CoA/propionyl-CoA carboxylase biotin carboxyl carrier protein
MTGFPQAAPSTFTIPIHPAKSGTTTSDDVAILEHPDFVAATHSTRWVEDVLDLSGVGSGSGGDDVDVPAGSVRRDTTVEVDGRRIEVSMWVPDPAEVETLGGRPRRSSAGSNASGGVGNGQVAVPMQGTIGEVLAAVGDAVEAGDTVCVLEAMKMENNVAAGIAGTVTEVKVAVGDSVGSGDIVGVIEAG